MSEKQWRVIADRDKGDDPNIDRDYREGDRLVFENWDTGYDDERQVGTLVRIERPVPTEHCLSTAQHSGHEWAAHEGQPGTGYWCPGFDAAEERPVPTTDEGEPMPVTLPVSPGDLETSADAVRDALRDQPRDIIRSELGTAARRLDMAAQFLRQTFDHQPSPHPPAREQIAEAQSRIDQHMQEVAHRVMEVFENADEDALAEDIQAEIYAAIGLAGAFGVALIQNGAKRG